MAIRESSQYHKHFIDTLLSRTQKYAESLHVLLNEIKKDTIQIPKFALDLHPKSLVRKVGIFCLGYFYFSYYFSFSRLFARFIWV